MNKVKIIAEVTSLDERVVDAFLMSASARDDSHSIDLLLAFKDHFDKIGPTESVKVINKLSKEGKIDDLVRVLEEKSSTASHSAPTKDEHACPSRLSFIERIFNKKPHKKVADASRKSQLTCSSDDKLSATETDNEGSSHDSNIPEPVVTIETEPVVTTQQPRVCSYAPVHDSYMASVIRKTEAELASKYSFEDSKSTDIPQSGSESKGNSVPLHSDDNEFDVVFRKFLHDSK